MFSDDDEALTWAGDKPDRVGARPRLTKPAKPAKPATSTKSAKPASSAKPTKASKSANSTSGPATAVEPDAQSEHRGLSNWEFLFYGIFAGIYLLYSVAWLITLLRNPLQLADPLGNVMFIEGLVLALCAPALWFIAVLFLGRNWTGWWRFGWLTLGALVLIPWPYLGWVG